MPDTSLFYPGSVDSHCHPEHMAQKDLRVAPLVDEAEHAGMRAIIDVGVDPGDLAGRQAVLGNSSIVHFTSGLHPTSVQREDFQELLDLLARQVGTEDLVAVGELGLDYHWHQETRERQHQALTFQFQLARDAGLPVIIHNRESEQDMLRMLREHAPTGVMHCFSQDSDYCRACLDLGMHISFGGNVTYKNAEAIRRAAIIVPDDRLLVETDAPYLSPVPVRGRANHPGHLGFTIRYLAGLRDTTPEHIARVSGENAIRLFGLGN
ncbi:MAG: TatD family deoxyribonuclease [Spirochaetales bacterium]|nr:MAG: TatD family deoxyribonuclease [Spirochaetales bacterium]